MYIHRKLEIDIEFYEHVTIQFRSVWTFYQYTESIRTNLINFKIPKNNEDTIFEGYMSVIFEKKKKKTGQEWWTALASAINVCIALFNYK